MCVVALGVSSFMQKASGIQDPKACGETVANDPGPWLLKRGRVSTVAESPKWKYGERGEICAV